MRTDYRKTFNIISIVFFIIAFIIIIIAIVFNKELKTAQKEESKLSSQIVTEAPTKVEEKDIINKKKNAINKIENEINEKTNNNSILSQLKDIINKIIAAMKFDDLNKEGLLNLKNMLRGNMTTECYNKTIRKFDIDLLDENNADYQNYEIRNCWYDIKNLNHPSVICLVDFENNDLSESRYLDFSFFYDKEKNRYILDNLSYGTWKESFVNNYWQRI